MQCRFVQKAGLIAALLLLLQGCATSRQSATTTAPAQLATPAVAPQGRLRDRAKSRFVPVADRQETPECPAAGAGPKRLVPLPDPVSGREGKHAPLGLDALEQLALNNNPSLAEAWARVEAARGSWMQAGRPPNPRVGYSGQQLGSGGQAEQRGAYIEQEFIRGGKLRLSQAVSRQEIFLAEQQFEIQRHRVITDVRTGFYAVLCAQRRLELTSELVRIGNQAANATEDLLAQKEGSRRDLLQARIESQSAQIFLQQARNQHLAAWRRLSAVLGLPQMPPAALAGQLDTAAIEYTWDSSIERLLAESPEMAAALGQVERARRAVDRARVEAVPDVNVQGVIQHDNSTNSGNGALLVSFPVPLLNRNRGRIRQAESELVAAERAVQRTKLALQHRLAPVFERYVSSRNRVDTFRTSILRDAEESLDLTRRGYEAGELSFLNLLTVQRTFFQSNLDYVDALCSMWAASAEIEGLLLTGSLEAGGVSSQASGRAFGPEANAGLPSMAGRL